MTENRRAYQDTHSFITFGADLSRVPYELWLMLGAAEAKCRYLAGIPLRPEIQQELNRLSLQKGIRATTAIEGNTLTEAEVEQIYREGSEKIPLSRKYQAQEIENVLEVYNVAASEITNKGACSISLESLKRDNAVVLRGVPLEDGVSAGELRTYPVLVGNVYKGAPAEDCEYLLERLFEWVSEDWGFSAEHKLAEGILKALILHLYLAWIHPFGDGNGRTARAVEFKMLINAGVPVIAAHLLTSYYNDTKDAYYEKLRISSRVEYGELEFIAYAVQGFVDALYSQTKSVIDEQVNVTWSNYVHEVCFSGNLTAAQRRRRDLLLAISSFKRPLTPSELRYRLPDKILRQYSNRPKTLSRDLTYLETEGLLVKANNGYTANKGIVRAFLPVAIG